MEIVIEGITKKFKEQSVLEQISFVMEEGSIHCLLGASGAGKTTLLRIITGALKADSGSVRIDNIPMPNRPILNKIGFMPQQDGLYNELSVYDNLRFFAGIQNLHGKEFDKKALELLEIVDLLKDKNKRVSHCSGGMKKRISLAAALIHSPQLLILDEPTVGIDPVLRRQIWNYLKDLKKQGKTLVVTTHVMDEVQNCDYAALLQNGHILVKDSVENLVQMANGGNIEELFFTNNSEEGKN